MADNPFESRIDMPDEIQNANSTTRWRQQNLRVLSDILEKVQRRVIAMHDLETLREVLIDVLEKVQRGENDKKKLEALKKLKVAARRGIGIFAFVIILFAVCGVLFSPDHYPQVLGAASIFLAFLGLVMTLIENIFKDKQEDLKEQITADSRMLDEIGAVVAILKDEFQSQDFIRKVMKKDNEEIMKKINEYFTRILEKLRRLVN